MLNKNKNLTKAQKLDLKRNEKIKKLDLRAKKFKARAIEQEKDPYIKAIYLKLTPEKLADYIKVERLKNKNTFNNKLSDRYVHISSNRAYKNTLNKKDRKDFVFNLFVESKFMQYFYGVGKEQRRIRWISNKELMNDSKQSLLFIFCFTAILASLDLITSILRYFRVL